MYSRGAGVDIHEERARPSAGGIRKIAELVHPFEIDGGADRSKRALFVGVHELLRADGDGNVDFARSDG